MRSWICYLMMICLLSFSVLALDSKSSLTPAELTSDEPILVKMPSYDVLKQDSASMKVDDSVLSYKDADLAELAIKGGKVKFGFKSAGSVTVSNIVRCDGAKTYTEYDPVGKQTWIYWNPVWQINGYNDVYDPDTKQSIMVPSYSNLVSIDCRCKKYEDRTTINCPRDSQIPEKVVSIGEEGVINPPPEKGTPIDIIPIEECKEVMVETCVLYTAHISFPFDGYDPLIETNTPPSISNIIVTGDAYNDTYTNWTALPVSTDVDTTDAIFNQTWFTNNPQGKNNSAIYGFDQAQPVNLVDNVTATMSGFTTYSGQMGNATVGDAAEPTMVAGKYGRGMGFDGVNDYIKVENSTGFLLGASYTYCTWMNYINTSNPNRILMTDSSMLFIAIGQSLQWYNNLSDSAATLKWLPQIPQHTWNYYCIYRDINNYVKLIFDGSEVNTSTAYAAGTLNKNIYLGNRQGLDRPLNGTLDNFVYYPCNLSSSQINRSMVSGGFPIDFSNDVGGGCAPTLFYGFENVGNGFVNSTHMIQNSNQDGSTNNRGASVRCDGVNDFIAVPWTNVSLTTMWARVNGTWTFFNQSDNKPFNGTRICQWNDDTFFNGSVDNVITFTYLLSNLQTQYIKNAWLQNSSTATLSSDETAQGENWTVSSRVCDYAACSPQSSKTLFITDCDQPYANTSWTYINSSCQFNASSNFYQFNRTQTTYFTGHFCLSAANTTFWEYNASVEEGCDYCGYQVNDTGYLSWLDMQVCQVTDLYQQNRTNTSYDMNYTACCAVTSFASDCYNNVTSTQYQNVTCNYCTYDIVYSTYSEWSNITDSCGNITRSYYDNAWDTCCHLTNLSTDCIVNDTSAGNSTYHQTLDKPCYGVLTMFDSAIMMLGLFILYAILLVAGYHYLIPALLLGSSAIGGFLGIWFVSVYGPLGDSLDLIKTGIGLVLLVFNAYVLYKTWTVKAREEYI